MADYFSRKPKKTPLFLANKLPSLWEAASVVQPRRAGKTKGFLGGAARPAAAGERRELGEAARHGAVPKPSSHFKAVVFKLNVLFFFHPHLPPFNTSLYAKRSYDKNLTQS